MRLNFWQWIGVILLIAAVAALVYRETRPKTTPTNPGATAPVVQPTR